MRVLLFIDYYGYGGIEKVIDVIDVFFRDKKKGIILAENHYLPVDKRGNVNVLVVGRFWFW